MPPGPAEAPPRRCPSCAAPALGAPFYEQAEVPSHSCLLLDDAREAREFPRGTLALAACGACGFIANVAVDPSLQAYSSRYEETQGFSPRFRAFADDLARRLVERHDLHGRDVLEIGCGKGEFLVELCELGRNRGVGVDPAFVPERLDTEAADRLTFIRDYWSERYAHLTCDLVVCRHTLEHIVEPGPFLDLLRTSIGERPETVVFFEVPDAMRVLREVAFWDVYYEHCSYFTAGALGRAFRRAGFRVDEVELAFEGQYLLLEAHPIAPGEDGGAPLALEEDVAEVQDAVRSYAARSAEILAGWRERLRDLRSSGRRAALWGSGSKGVAFLTALGLEEDITCVVDINPHRQGKHMAGTGHPIVAPEDLVAERPDVVIAMNAAYREEIGASLDALGLHPELLAL